MKNIKQLLLAGLSFCSLAVMAQTNTTSPNQVPVNAGQTIIPPPVQNPPVQNPPVSAPQGTAPNNKVMLKAQTDSMDAVRRTPPPAQNIYRDTTRQLIHQGDTETTPRPRR